MSHLTLEGISKSFRSVKVLHNINLQVKAGEFICLLGPSGSGKSTILRMIGGFEQPDVGRILLDGKVIQDFPPNKRNIGFVFQDYALFPHMTVKENIAFGLKCRKTGKGEMNERIQSVLELVGLTGLENRYPKQLSGGQQQRVAIARAIALRPSLLLLDEPLSNLDAKLRRQIRLEIRALQKKLGITTIMVTHDQEEAMSMGDRIALLQNGVIQQLGEPLELYNQPANLFVASFLGDPPINLLRGRIEKMNGIMGISVLNLFFPFIADKNAIDASRLLDKECVMGIRPEDVQLVPSGNDGVLAVVEAVELLGSANSVHLLVEKTGDKLRALTHAKWAPKSGERVNIRWNAENCRLFDGETKKLLSDVNIAPYNLTGIGG